MQGSVVPVQGSKWFYCSIQCFKCRVQWFHYRIQCFKYRVHWLDIYRVQWLGYIQGSLDGYIQGSMVRIHTVFTGWIYTGFNG